MKKKQKDAEFLERQNFLEVYSEFNKWLCSLGFRQGDYWNESSTPLDYNYSYYDSYVNSISGVEHYIQDVLKLSIRFLRDKNEHKLMFVGDWGAGTCSKVHTIEEAKGVILFHVKKLRDEQLSKLNSIIL